MEARKRIIEALVRGLKNHFKLKNYTFDVKFGYVDGTDAKIVIEKDKPLNHLYIIVDEVKTQFQPIERVVDTILHEFTHVYCADRYSGVFAIAIPCPDDENSKLHFLNPVFNNIIMGAQEVVTNTIMYKLFPFNAKRYFEETFRILDTTRYLIHPNFVLTNITLTTKLLVALLSHLIPVKLFNINIDLNTVELIERDYLKPYKTTIEKTTNVTIETLKKEDYIEAFKAFANNLSRELVGIEIELAKIRVVNPATSKEFETHCIRVR